MLQVVSMIIIVLVINYIPPALASSNGAKIFQIHCAGCHPQGANIIRRGKTLKKEALKKYKMDSLEAITDLVTNGRNNMSAFQDKLTEQQIQDVANYVLEQADKNWR
jgi:cytochrome c6